MNWVKELKIKNFDGVFNKDSRQWASNCGVINLDSNNGPGTHVILILFILIPLDYHCLKIFFLSNDTVATPNFLSKTAFSYRFLIVFESYRFMPFQLPFEGKKTAFKRRFFFQPITWH